MRNEDVKYCVLVPTYNNDQTLVTVLEDILKYTTDIIVVNDGSTDDTAQKLEAYKHIPIVEYSPNKGKGYALRKGFEEASKLGYTHAITIDSDGQHKAADLPAFFDVIQKEPNSLFIGSRNMKQTNVPGSSNFGNNFSNFWFKFETGINAPDTQSGYRAYPIHLFKGTHFITTKYEFEIEVLVRSAWKDIPIQSIPIDVYYPPEEERISHFRKVPDFTRISILNTILVVMAIFYFKPRNFLRNLKKKTLNNF